MILLTRIGTAVKCMPGVKCMLGVSGMLGVKCMLGVKQKRTVGEMQSL